MELKSTVQAQGFGLNFVLRALFALHNMDGKMSAMLIANVDGLLTGFLPEGEAAVQCILDRFQVGTIESQNFGFCGKEYVQDG